MAKQINVHDNRSLSELDLVAKEVVAFDNSDREWPSPFLLAIPEKLVRGFNRDTLRGLRGLSLVFAPEHGKREEWTLYIRGAALCLWAPIYREGERVPNYFAVDPNSSYFTSYAVESAYSGCEAIKQALANHEQELDFYAAFLESGKLVTERGKTGRFFESLGLRCVLPNQLRFRR